MLKTVISKLASKFLADEDGAVTVDWVVLTAGVVLLGVLVVGGISTSLNSAATEIASSISAPAT